MSTRRSRRATALAPLLLALLMTWPAGVTLGSGEVDPPPQTDGWGKLAAYGSCALGIAGAIWRNNPVGLVQALTFCGIRLAEEKT